MLAIGILVAGPENRAADAVPSGVPGTERGTVERVVDGDTITVRLNGATERVRYVGVDAPELARPSEGREAECGGNEATDANRALVEGREIVLERDTTDRDRFGRLLRHVWLSDGQAWQLVTERLVADGAIEARSYPPDTSRDAQLDAAEAAARANQRGIWGDC